jgi:Protein of unknown function (DUF2846)
LTPFLDTAGVSEKGSKMSRVWWLVPVALLVLAGCVSYTPPAPSPLASPASDAQAKKFAPPQGKGNVYVSRPGEFTILGKPTPYGVTLDGKEVGGIMPDMYFCFTLEPGDHTLSATCRDSIYSVTVRAEAGKNSYYQLSTSTADNKTKLSLGLVILEPMGKLMVNNTRRGQAVIE